MCDCISSMWFRRKTCLPQGAPNLANWQATPLVPPRLKKRGKLANSFFFWTQLDMRQWFADETEFANRGKLTGKLANSLTVLAPMQAMFRMLAFHNRSRPIGWAPKRHRPRKAPGLGAW